MLNQSCLNPRALFTIIRLTIHPDTLPTLAQKWSIFIKQLWPILPSLFNYIRSMDNYLHTSKVWVEITYLLPNFNGATIDVWEWITIFIPHFIMFVIAYPRWHLSQSMLLKWDTAGSAFIWKIFVLFTNLLMMGAARLVIQFYVDIRLQI